ncbi:MAG: thrombospondin type 3 repeat-containing protein, partial [Acidobacteriota bacterium]|nr:thrombospondin type 3 repeat-containing protein [Acidobacteriota bacterium]
MQVSVSKMTVYRAWRPPLPDGQDCDTDTVINEMDNCPLIPNPMQEDINMDGFGDACSLNDPTTGQPIIPDRDGDRIADFADNCVWVPNTDQDDMDAGTFLRGIGDACQDEADVMLPQMPTVFNFPNPNFPVLDIPIQNGDITFALVDFSSDPSEMDAPVTCTTTQPMNCGDAPSMLTSCTLDDQLVQVNVF